MKADVGITGLSDAIEALRTELLSAAAQGSGGIMNFSIGPIEVEIEAVVTVGGDGKIGWGVLGIGGKRQSETTHKLKLSLQPFWPDENRPPGEFAVSDEIEEDVRVGGASAEKVDSQRPRE